jgi:hypothetical protein
MEVRLLHDFIQNLVHELTVALRAVLSVGNREKYYGKWDQFTKRSEEELLEEEEEAKRIEKERLAKIPDSEADKRDREKREALKEAKKQWDNVSKDNTNAKHSLFCALY